MTIERTHIQRKVGLSFSSHNLARLFVGHHHLARSKTGNLFPIRKEYKVLKPAPLIQAFEFVILFN